MENPFESGRGMVFKSKSTASNKRYLNSSPGAAAKGDKSFSVYLSDSADFRKNPGCYWKSIHVVGDKVRLQTVSTSSNLRFLDSSSAAPRKTSVYLAGSSAGDGSHWTPKLLPDRNFSMQSDTPSGPKKFLKANPCGTKDDSVYMTESSETAETHWNIGFTYHTGEEVESIVHAAYPNVPIINNKEGTNYGSLDYDGLHSIWNDSQLANYQLAEEKFGDADFAVCLKAHVAKDSYSADLPDDKGSLCGIMWTSIGGKIRALNFTVDAFGMLVVLDPQNGQQIATTECTPTFCML